MKNIYALFLGIVFFASAHAETKRAPASASKVVYEKKTRLDFEEKEVDGQFATPEGMAVKADKNLEFDSLLAPKKNFKKELNRDSGAIR